MLRASEGRGFSLAAPTP